MTNVAMHGSADTWPSTDVQGAPGVEDAAALSTAPTTLMPEPADSLIATGDPGAEIAALALRSGVAERRAARALRDAEEAVAEHEADAQVQAMHDKASSMRTQAWFDAGMTVAVQAVGAKSTAGCALSAGEKLGDGMFGADQQDDDASAKGHEAAADHASRAAKDAQDALADANDCIKAALQFYGEYASTRAQTLMAALHRT